MYTPYQKISCGHTGDILSEILRYDSNMPRRFDRTRPYISRTTTSICITSCRPITTIQSNWLWLKQEELKCEICTLRPVVTQVGMKPCQQGNVPRNCGEKMCSFDLGRRAQCRVPGRVFRYCPPAKHLHIEDIYFILQNISSKRGRQRKIGLSRWESLSPASCGPDNWAFAARNRTIGVMTPVHLYYSLCTADTAQRGLIVTCIAPQSLMPTIDRQCLHAVHTADEADGDRGLLRVAVLKCPFMGCTTATALKEILKEIRVIVTRVRGI